MINGKKIENLSEIINAECLYKWNDLDTWNEASTLECVVVGVDCEILDTIPYTFEIFFKIKPLKKNKLSKDHLYQMECTGVGREYLIFI